MHGARSASVAFILLAALAGRAVAQNVLASKNSNGDQSDEDAAEVSTSDDGNLVVMTSAADNLGEGSDHNGVPDVFLRDFAAGRTIRVSQTAAGGDGNRQSHGGAISGDGHFVAFTTDASNLFPSDFNNASDVLVYDVSAATLELVSVRTNGVHGNGYSDGAALSQDGNLVAFRSLATNMVFGDTNGVGDIFVRDRAAGTTKRVSVAADGSEADGESVTATLSADGRFVCFSSRANNFVPSMANGYFNVFVKDTVTGAIEIENLTVDGNKPQGGDSFGTHISADGNVVVFESEADNLFPGDTPFTREIYVHDRTTNQTELASISLAGGLPDQQCYNGCISGDGRLVYFVSNATNLVDGTGGTWQIFVRDRLLGITMLAVYDRDDEMVQDGVLYPSVTPDGSHLSFVSGAQNLTDDDTRPYSIDVFVRTQSVDPATSSNYGSGWPGTNGVPWFVATPPPALGQAVTLAAENSLGRWSVGLLLAGAQSADLPTGFGGDLALLPTFAYSLAIPPQGVTFTGTVPADERLVDLSYYAQLLQQDPGASDGVSFTQGLQLTFGF
jgi:Tol biopolymer transport system component